MAAAHPERKMRRQIKASITMILPAAFSTKEASGQNEHSLCAACLAVNPAAVQ
jgi:hypothetical protein